MADRFPLILNTSANQIQEIASGDSLDLTGSNISNAGIITAGNVTIGAATTDLLVNGNARVTGILTIGTSSITLDESSNTINVGTALTLGHTQGFQFHTQNLHSTGFEVNQINASGIITATQADINGDLDVDGHTNLDNASIAGVTTFADNAKAIFGTGGDLEIYHTGSGSVINDVGSGSLHLRRAGSNRINIQTDDVTLCYQGNVKLTTTNTGINVTGNAVATGADINGDLDVDGHTNLDNVSIAGVTTFAGASTINNLLYVKGAESTDGIIALYADEGDDTADMWRMRSGTDGSFYIDNYANSSWQTSFRAHPNNSFLYYQNNSKVYTTATGIHVQNNVSGDTSKVQIQKASGDAEVVCQRTGGSGVKLRGSHPQSFLETITNSDLILRRNSVTRIQLNSSGNTITGDTTFQNGITGTTATFSGNVSVGGVLTYEDVTNVDSVGIITARNGINVSSGTATFAGAIDANGDLDVDGHTNLDNVSIAGVSTFSGNILPGTDSSHNLGSNGVRFANIYGDALYGVIQNSTHTNITRVGTLSQLAVSGSANPLNVTHTGANCVNLNRGSKSIGIDVNYGDSDTHSLVSLTTGMDLRFKLGGADRIVFKSAGHIEPQTDSQINLGSNSVRFANAYVDTYYGDGSNLTGISVGGSTGIDFNDNVQVRFGTGNDAQLLHTGSQFRILNDTGDFYIKGAAAGNGDMFIQAQSGVTNARYFANSGATFYFQGNQRLTINTKGIAVGTGGASIGSTVETNGQATFTGIVTASSFKLSDGSNVGGVDSDAQENTIAGTGAGENFSGTNPRDNSLFGHNAGNDITGGDYNTLIGSSAGAKITTGHSNICVGSDTLGQGTSSHSNIIIGRSAAENLTNHKNVAIGNEAMKYATSSSECVFVGAGAGGNITTGGYSVAVGQQAGLGGWNSGTGNYNTSVGHEAGKRYTSGDSNSVFGVFAGDNITSGNNNVCIGANAGDTGTNNLTTGSNNILIGHDAQATSSSVSNEVTIGDANITKFRIPGINVTLKDNGGTPTQGHVLTVDSNGEAGFAAVSGVSVANQSNNRLITCSGSTDALNSEANLTYDAVTLKNIISVSGSVPDLLEFRNSASTWGGGFRFGTNNSYGALYITNNDKSVTVGLFNSTGGWNWGSNLHVHGNITPHANNTYDLGTSTYRWRNLYTNDINLSNEGGANDVDGTWGNYTIQEGESDLFLINKRNGKKYKFNLTEVS